MRRAEFFQAREIAKVVSADFNEFNFDTLLKEIQSEHSKRFPYNHDYQMLNQILFYLNEEENIDKKPGDAIATQIATTYLDNILYFATVWTTYRAAQLAIDTPEFAEFKNSVFNFYLYYKNDVLKQEESYFTQKLKNAQADLQNCNDTEEQSEIENDMTRFTSKIAKTNNLLTRMNRISNKDYYSLKEMQISTRSEITNAENKDDTPPEITSGLSFLDDLLNEFDEKLNAILCIDAKRTEWQTLMLDTYQNLQTELKLSQNPRDFIEFILKEARVYSPEQYISFEIADKKFPTSNTNIGLSHLDARDGKALLAMSAPMKSVAIDPTKKEKINSETLNQFQKTLTSQRIKQIIALGDNDQRLDYRDIATTLGIKIIQVNVCDNQSLHFDSATLEALLAAYDKYQKGIPTAVHCDSGVGRTGQLRLLFAMLDKHNNDKNFQRICSNINAFACAETPLDHDQADLLKENLSVFFSFMSETLCSLRQTRYCIQTDEQFIKTLPLLLLMTAPTEDNKEKLRQHFSDEAAHPLERTDYSFASYATGSSDDASSTRSSPLESKRFFDPRSYVRPTLQLDSSSEIESDGSDASVFSASP